MGNIMKDIIKNTWSKIKANKTNAIILAIVVVVLILIGLFSNGSLNIDKLGFASKDQEASLLESQLFADLIKDLENKDLESEKEDGYVNQFVSVVDGLYYYHKVKVPVLSNPDLFDHNGQKALGCGDEIVWVVASLEKPTRAPLTAATNILFTNDEDYGFKPGNFLATQEDLSFEKVVIEDRIAKFYLNGEYTVEDECDSPRQFIQLEEVAMQFDSVDGVQIYLNNELLR